MVMIVDISCSAAENMHATAQLSITVTKSAITKSHHVGAIVSAATPL